MHFPLSSQIQDLDKTNLAEEQLNMFLSHKKHGLGESRRGDSCWLTLQCAFAVLSPYAAGTEMCSPVLQVRKSFSHDLHLEQVGILHELIPEFSSGSKLSKLKGAIFS